MAKQKRSDDWGFPALALVRRKGRDAAKLRLCDREGCSEIGDRPAPKAPNSTRALVFLRGARRRIQQELELFRRASAPRKRRAGRRRKRADDSGFPPVGAMEMGRAGRRHPQPRRNARARRARAGSRRRLQGRQGGPPAAGQGHITPTRTPATRKPPSASSRSRRPTTSYAGPRNGRTSKPVSRTTRGKKIRCRGLPACRLHNNFLAAPESCRSVQSQAATCCYRGLKMDRYRQYRSRLSRPSCHLTLVSTYSV